MIKLPSKIRLLAAFTLSFSVHLYAEQPLNQIYHVLNYSCYQAYDNSGNVVEYCSPLQIDSVEEFAVPMGGMLTEEGRLDAALKYAKNKDKDLEKAKSPQPVNIPVPVAASGGRSGSTATTSAGGDLKNPNPQYLLEKAEIAVKQAQTQYDVDLRRLENERKALSRLQAKVEETQAAAEKAVQIAKANPSDIAQRKAREAEATARYHASRLHSNRMETYEKRVANSAQKLAEAKANAEDVRARYASGETVVE